MGTWTLRKPEPSHIQATCVSCGSRPQKKKTNGKFAAECSTCSNKRYGTHYADYDLKRHTYRSYKNGCCEACGFEPEHECQLDVDHINGDHSDNRPENLQTLCANCHRLKTYKQRWQ